MYKFTFTLHYTNMKPRKKTLKTVAAVRLDPKTKKALIRIAKREGYRTFSLWLSHRLDQIAASEGQAA